MKIVLKIKSSINYFTFKFFVSQLFDDVSVSSCALNHLSEHATLHQQLVRRSNLSNSALVHHNHLVIIGDCVEAMCDRDHCGLCEFGLDAFLDEVVGHHIHIRSGLVQN